MRFDINSFSEYLGQGVLSEMPPPLVSFKGHYFLKYTQLIQKWYCSFIVQVSPDADSISLGIDLVCHAFPSSPLPSGEFGMDIDVTDLISVEKFYANFSGAGWFEFDDLPRLTFFISECLTKSTNWYKQSISILKMNNLIAAGLNVYATFEGTTPELELLESRIISDMQGEIHPNLRKAAVQLHKKLHGNPVWNQY